MGKKRYNLNLNIILRGGCENPEEWSVKIPKNGAICKNPEECKSIKRNAINAISKRENQYATMSEYPKGERG